MRPGELGASVILPPTKAPAVDRGRDGALAPPLPPNRTGGFPASGSPVDGVSARESALFARFPRPPSVRQSHPSHMILAESSAAQPLRALAAVHLLSFGPASFHLPALPSLHDRYSFHRYYGCSDFVLGGSSASERHELRDSQADLPDYCAWSSCHSLSNHLRSVRSWRGISPFRSPDARGFYPPRQASHRARRLAHLHRPNRVHCVRLYRRTALRTGRSRSVALHPVFPRRSYGSIPHDSSPHKSGLSPLRPSTLSGARARPSSGAETSEGYTRGNNPERQASLKLLRPGTAALRKFPRRLRAISTAAVQRGGAARNS